MSSTRERRSTILTLLGCALVLSAGSGPARAELRAQVYGAAQSVFAAAYGGSVVQWTSPGGRSLELDLDPSAYAGDRFAGVVAWTPLEEAVVREAVASMRPLVGEDLEVRIYCLPGLPVAERGSFCAGDEIFLAPAFARPADETVAYVVVHEIGHALENERLGPEGGPGWRAFARLRGLDSRHRPDAPRHRDRPAEIFAEDFRLLFGGASARASGAHENPEIAPADRVEGLDRFFRAVLEGRYRAGVPLARLANHPNPFNPRTTIVLELAPGLAEGVARGEVFDLRGRRVARLPERPVADRVEWVFDAVDDAGRALASGRYAYRVVAGEVRATGSFTLLR